MSDVPSKTVAQKMGIRAGSRAHFVDAPRETLKRMGLPELWIEEELNGGFDYLHLFTWTQNAMMSGFPLLKDHLRRDGMLWVSWPKGGRLGTDLNMKSVIRIGYDYGLVESVCLRVDDVWAGLKFTRPKPGKVYRNSYGTLPDAR
ncbi:hypothetical protein [Streptomonospora litoralis]|uniref:DUF3052 domain-containing protein n=1 Tax=Streptomonospora litoralis TaxID=2498135 RepID=A0A4P6PV47_9ACTN|nr:hypothetical protein [Streptomonospora litoralis]QBI52066.1 hypothetical protein EKD16_01245 [Streptomonospora litoralis]